MSLGTTVGSQRSDLGSNIFNSAKKREQCFCPYLLFCKEKKLEYSERNKKYTVDELRKCWNSIKKSERTIYETRSAALLARGPYLGQEVIDIIKRTNGFITWKQIQDIIGHDVCCVETIRKHVTYIPSFRYTVNEVFPLLNKAKKKRRYA